MLAVLKVGDELPDPRVMVEECWICWRGIENLNSLALFLGIMAVLRLFINFLNYYQSFLPKVLYSEGLKCALEGAAFWAVFSFYCRWKLLLGCLIS